MGIFSKWKPFKDLEKGWKKLGENLNEVAGGISKGVGDVLEGAGDIVGGIVKPIGEKIVTPILTGNYDRRAAPTPKEDTDAYKVAQRRRRQKSGRLFTGAVYSSLANTSAGASTGLGGSGRNTALRS